MADSENKQEIQETAADPNSDRAPEAKPAPAPGETPKKHSNLFVRVMSVIVLLPLLLALIIFGTSSMWAVFIGIAAFLGMLEFMRITNGEESTVTRVVSAVFAMVPAVAAYLVVGEKAPFQMGENTLFAMGTAIAVTMWGAFLFNCFRPREIPKASSVINATMAGAMYVGFTFLFLALFKRDFANGNAWIFTLMAMTWGSDTGAYFVGRAFGKHKLAPILSPKKSIEGAIGGFGSAILAALIARFLAFPDIDCLSMIGMAVVANFFAQMGDLSESLLKRSHGIKDSGNVIPGHGGVLDRVDALIFSAPWVYGFACYMS